MPMDDIFKDVKKNKYGYYELEKDFVKEDIALLYQDSYYQNEMALYQKEYAEEELEEKYSRLEEKRYILENLLSIPDENKKILDIGCGEGFALKFFGETGYDVSGVEFSLEGCRQHNPDVVDKIVVGDAFEALSQMKQEDYKGTILMDHVLEHVVDPERLVKKITEISAPGTCLVISVPNDFSDTQKKLYGGGYIKTAFWVSSEYPPEHLSYFNKEGLENLMAEYGWKMEVVTGSYPIDFNLFNEDTNYVEKKDVGKNCYKSGLEIEKLMRDAMGLDKFIDVHRKFGEAGLGRSLTAYFILRKEGISIRKIREQELALVLKWRTDPDISKYMKSDFRATLEMQKQWYADVQKDNSKRYWMIEIDSVPVGVICLTDMDYNLKTCEWGYYIAEKAQRSFAAAVSIECSLYDYVFQ
ncbi:MAG: GNAT family N-acetyltransferase, partial [Lachnospiraceae bacterium]|nr:GNAT family N-acetyltransferase [Lachnospiraceae bacterium]